MGWRQSTQSVGLTVHAPIAVRPRSRTGEGDWREALRRPKTNPKPQRWATQAERFAWERIQHRWFKDRKGGVWTMDDGSRVWGPPIPPDAVVVTTNAALDGFRKANELGFWPGMEVCKKLLGIEKPRPSDRQRVTTFANKYPEIVRCVVRHPHYSLANCWKHCRFYKLDEMEQHKDQFRGKTPA